MIDSSGRRGLRANGTVLDVLPVGHVVGVTGALLVAVFTLVKPEASHGLDLAERILFWTLHVGLGFGALWVSGRWLASGVQLPQGTLASVLITGCAGALLATPGYMALDALYTPHIVDLDPDPPVGGVIVQLIGEFVELAPWFLAAWLVVNLPVLLPTPAAMTRLEDAVEHAPDDDLPPEPGRKPAPPATIESSSRLQLVTDNASIRDDSMNPANRQAAQRFLLTLPGVVGTDVIAVASDLHYLNVWTVAGRTTVLGNLRDVVAELDAIGMQVHRSHWVAHAHVRRIVGNSSDAACILSNELRVPISRRRWKAVREQYGRGVVHTAAPGSENIG